jgi:hypothetical protein
MSAIAIVACNAWSGVCATSAIGIEIASASVIGILILSDGGAFYCSDRSQLLNN